MDEDVSVKVPAPTTVTMSSSLAESNTHTSSQIQNSLNEPESEQQAKAEVQQALLNTCSEEQQHVNDSTKCHRKELLVLLDDESCPNNMVSSDQHPSMNNSQSESTGESSETEIVSIVETKGTIAKAGQNDNIKEAPTTMPLPDGWSRSNILVKSQKTVIGKSETVKLSAPRPKLTRADLVANTMVNSGEQNRYIGSKTRPLLLSQASTTSVNRHNSSLNHDQSETTSSTTKCAITSIIPALSSSQLLISSILTTQSKAPLLDFAQQINNVTTTTSQCSATLEKSLATAATAQTLTAPKILGNIASTPTSSHEYYQIKTVAKDSTPETKRTSAPRRSNSSGSENTISGSSVNSPGSCQLAGNNASPAGNAAAARLTDMGKKLLDAARGNQVEQVRQLVVDSGAPFTSDWFGTTALHLAAQNGHREIAEILLKGGVNRDARTKLERTALHLAAQNGSLGVVDLLLSHGADIGARDMLKMTPLHWAVERGHVLCVERLLMAGSDVNARSKFRLTPVDIARNSEFYGILDLFKNWPGLQKEEKLDLYQNTQDNMNESHEALDCDYQLSPIITLVDSATTSRGESMFDTEEPCIDLVELEWNKLDFEPDLFMSMEESDDEPRVEYLMKVVEELQKENRQLRQQVEQLSTTSP